MSTCEAPGRALASVEPDLLVHLDALYRYALALTRSRTEAEDLVQETYLRALRASTRLRPDSQLKSWLFTILRHVFLNQIRRGPARSEMIAIDAEETPESAWNEKRGDDPHSVLVKQIEREQVRAALAALPSMYREVLVLREFEGLSYQQMAEVLDCPVGTVMSRLGRARDNLKKSLLKFEATPKNSKAKF